jgi:hypothetical protein
MMYDYLVSTLAAYDIISRWLIYNFKDQLQSATLRIFQAAKLPMSMRGVLFADCTTPGDEGMQFQAKMFFLAGNI